MHWHLILISTCANILQEKFFLNSCRIPLYKGHRSLGHRWGPYHDIQTSSRAFDIYNEYIWLSDLRWKDNFESMIVCLLFDIRFKNFHNYWDVSIAFNLFFLAYCYFISKSEYFLYHWFGRKSCMIRDFAKKGLHLQKLSSRRKELSLGERRGW